MSVPPLSAIGDQVDPVSSWTPERDDPDGMFMYVDLSAVDQDAKVVSGARELVCSDAPSRARQLLRAGDVLVSTVRPNLNGVALVPPELDGATASTGFCVLRPRASQLDARYLYQWVKSPRFVSDMVRKATGASYPAVSDRIVCESKLPLPPLPEQRRIAEILDKADALRAKRHAALAQLDTLTQSIFLDMFGDPATNPEGWPVKRIEDITECLDRLRRPVTESDRKPGNVPYYGANGQQGWIDTALFNEPLVLVAEDGGYFDAPERGVAYRIDGSAWVNNHAHILRATPTHVDTEFLHRALRHFNFLPFISGTTRAKLTQGQLNAVKLYVPPLDLQRQFGERVAGVQRIAQVTASSADQFDELFASLQYRSFRGEL